MCNICAKDMENWGRTIPAHRTGHRQGHFKDNEFITVFRQTEEWKKRRNFFLIYFFPALKLCKDFQECWHSCRPLQGFKLPREGVSLVSERCLLTGLVGQMRPSSSRAAGFRNLPFGDKIPGWNLSLCLANTPGRAGSRSSLGVTIQGCSLQGKELSSCLH